ncbi:inositol monophosphatase [Nonomuraea deserti]|uniref:Inositol monophosphatase n=1 Tax=Nonomuraea deserti TaxID=1848322 RepID=A0A4R4VZW5_9ACTN|nr:inositol monophosphatase [Nonomuraea deserti]TDD11061.1 inositol monophosphatase [Nonomuraea deserti]
MDHVGLVALAAAAAVEAGSLLVTRYGPGVATRAKSGRHDVVTEADGQAESLIRTMLAASCPDSVIVGEETGASGAGEVEWYVDPIDGTHNFARGLGLYAVSIGVSVRGEPVGGAVYEPTRGELFTAAGGVLRIDGRPAPPRAAEPDPLPVVLTDIPTPGVRDPAEARLHAELVETADVRRIGSSALALAYVAAGRADLAVNADVFVWDVAAGRSLVSAAGGGFAGVPGEPGTQRRSGFVAWGPLFAAHGSRLSHRLAEFAELAVRNLSNAWPCPTTTVFDASHDADLS